MATPEETWLNMTKDRKVYQESEVAAVYDKLNPVETSFLLGDWTGGDLDTGHAGTKALKDMRWAGKSFRSTEDVDPIIIYNDKGERVWNEEYGHAVLREVKFRGVVSTAMIYDNFPIIDHFRYVNDSMVAGAMDTKVYGNTGVYYFYLTKMTRHDKASTTQATL